VYQNDWVEPILVKVNHCKLKEAVYDGSAHIANVDLKSIRKQLVYMLIQGRVNERLDFKVDEIERNLGVLNLSSRNRILLKEQIAEWKAKKSLSIWREEDFPKLSRQIVDVLDVRSRVESYVPGAVDNADLSEKLALIVKQSLIDVSNAVTVTVSQCLMRDYSAGRDETDKRENLYKQWVESVQEKGGKR